MAYGSSQPRGQIGATAARLHYSHSNPRSEPRPRSTPQLTATQDPKPLNKAKDQTRVLMDTGQIRYC